MFNLAKRFKENYPSVFPDPISYDPNIYNFRSSISKRASESGLEFARGLFDEVPFAFQTTSLPADKDIFYRFFDMCPVYEPFVDEAILQSQYEVREDEFRKQLAMALSKKIFPDDALDSSGLPFAFTHKDAKTIWVECVYDIIFYDKSSEWCSFFSEEDAITFNYFKDLKKHFSCGRGLDLSWQMSCDLLANIFDSMEEKVNGGLEAARLQFAHAETILPIVAYLNIFSDDIDIVNNPEAVTKRNWNTTVISPFGANFQFVLYECPQEDFKVKFLLNEKEYVIPGCETMYCPLEKLLGLFPDVTANVCPFSQLCSVPPQDSPLPPQDNSIVL